MYGPYLTMAEIEAKYPDAWVLLDRPQTDRYGNLLGGHVAASSPDRAEFRKLTEDLPLSNHVTSIHTGGRPFTVVGDASASLPHTLFKCFVLLLLVGGVGWITHGLTVLAEVPTAVRTYRAHSARLDAHANAVRDGRIQPEPDPNNILRYPLTPELREAGIVLCIVEHGLIWYWLPGGLSIDAGRRCLVTPLDRAAPIAVFPGRVPFGTYEFTTLPQNWAYWFVATG